MIKVCYDTYDDFINELVDEYEVGSQIFFLEDTTEVVDASYDRTKKLKGQCRDYLTTRRSENEEELVSLDVSKLDALSFLYY